MKILKLLALFGRLLNWLVYELPTWLPEPSPSEEDDDINEERLRIIGGGDAHFYPIPGIHRDFYDDTSLQAYDHDVALYLMWHYI